MIQDCSCSIETLVLVGRVSTIKECVLGPLNVKDLSFSFKYNTSTAISMPTIFQLKLLENEYIYKEISDPTFSNGHKIVTNVNFSHFLF